jgi:serine-type D-Ala-D-Ala endopeptidase (penicillin-binding protein 7)
MIKKFILLLLFFHCTAFAKQDHSHWIYNLTTDDVITGVYMNEQRPIASLTKLMTALLVMESKQSLDEKISYRGGIFQSKLVSRQDLLESLLIRSDNAAADALAKAWPGGRNNFVEKMNSKAKELKLTQTKFVDPSGLGKGNVSTAAEFSIIVIEAAKYDLIKNVSSSRFLVIERKINKKIKQVQIPNTNKELLFDFDNIVLSKTGFTNPAGRCLALMVEKQKQKYVIVILGEKTPQSRTERARHLINNYAIINENEGIVNENRIHMFNF